MSLRKHRPNGDILSSYFDRCDECRRILRIKNKRLQKYVSTLMFHFCSVACKIRFKDSHWQRWRPYENDLT